MGWEVPPQPEGTGHSCDSVPSPGHIHGPAALQPCCQQAWLRQGDGASRVSPHSFEHSNVGCAQRVHWEQEGKSHQQLLGAGTARGLVLALPGVWCRQPQGASAPWRGQGWAKGISWWWRSRKAQPADKSQPQVELLACTSPWSLCQVRAVCCLL